MAVIALVTQQLLELCNDYAATNDITLDTLNHFISNF